MKEFHSALLPRYQRLTDAAQTDAKLEHPTYAVIEPVRSFDNASIKDWQKRHLAPDAEVYSDGLFCLTRLRRLKSASPLR